MSLLTLHHLSTCHQRGEPIAVLTAYDASFAHLFDQCGIDALLVGDSLGNVIQGHATTLPVSLEDMIYHTACVARGRQRAFLISDLPFGSYQKSPEQAFESAIALLHAGAQCVKLEGGAHMAPTVEFLVSRGIPVCGHIGLTPQSIHQLGGYRVQGRGEEGGEKLLQDALALEQAGAALLVLELMPSILAEKITHALSRCLTIGIGAGSRCDGQVMVMHDMLGITPPPHPKFVKVFANGVASLERAVKAYIQEVKSRQFPDLDHEYT